MTTLYYDFNYTYSPFPADLIGTGTFAIADGALQATSPVAGAYRTAHTPFTEARVRHQDDPTTGAIGAVVGPVRLLAEPGGTWRLSTSSTVFDTWTGLGPAAGHVTRLVARNFVYWAYLDDDLLGTWVDTAQMFTSSPYAGVYADECTAAVEDLLVTQPNFKFEAEGFSRPELGTTSPDGHPFEGLGDWHIVDYVGPATDTYVAPVTSGEHQLVWDATSTNYKLDVYFYPNPEEDGGAIIRWIDSGNFIGICSDPTTSKIRIYNVVDGAVTLDSEWYCNFVDDFTGTPVMTVEAVGEWISIQYNLNAVAVTSNALHPTGTRTGVWSRAGAQRFTQINVAAEIPVSGILEYGRHSLHTYGMTRARTIDPGHLQMNPGSIYQPAQLDAGHLQQVGRYLYQQPDYELRPGYLAVHPIDFRPRPALQAGPNNASPVGIGRVPVGLQPLLDGPVSLIDEHGDFIIDEEGNVISF